MADRLRVACVQFSASGSKSENLETRSRSWPRAAATGADLVVLPEKWNGIGSVETILRRRRAARGRARRVGAMARWAKQHGITLVGGSITESREGREKLSNTCVVFDPEGELAAVYRKIHMFDVEVGGQVYRESETEEPGEETVVCEIEGWRLGLTVCYDLRFPELYRMLAARRRRAHHGPGRVHALHRQGSLGAPPARAGGREPVLRRRRRTSGACTTAGKATYGRSLDRRSLGRRARPGARRGRVISAELDRAHMERIRRSLPSLANRQPAAYTWPAEV